MSEGAGQGEVTVSPVLGGHCSSQAWRMEWRWKPPVHETYLRSCQIYRFPGPSPHIRNQDVHNWECLKISGAAQLAIQQTLTVHIPYASLCSEEINLFWHLPHPFPASGTADRAPFVVCSLMAISQLLQRTLQLSLPGQHACFLQGLGPFMQAQAWQTSSEVDHVGHMAQT